MFYKDKLQKLNYFLEILLKAFCQSMFRVIIRIIPIAKSHLTQNGILPQVWMARWPLGERMTFDQIEGVRSFGSSLGNGRLAIGMNAV